MKLRFQISMSLVWLVSLAVQAQSFVHQASSYYQWPTDEKVVEHLKDWQDQKFGIIMHWGLYSVPGICESWTLTSEDWITPDPELSYEDYKKWYWGLIKDFNPTRFNPQQWAEVAADAGMRYMVFTTKHHDGFCLFDTKQTDFSVMNSPFGSDSRANVAKYIFEAFRQKGMMTGCYFSKPDWHSQDYWWDKRAAYNRSHNYNIAQYPERWKSYKSFVYNQIEELMSDYGKMDILWLDGGWCAAPYEDIGLDSIVDNARVHQPGLIVVERACAGKHENYQTPEQKVPDAQILNPWESCITLTYDWGWTDHPVFKSPAKIIATLSEVVAKGGSLLLGVGPTPEGLIEEGAVERLHQIGNWLRTNGKAIYSTVPTPVYTNKDKSVWFTADKDGRTLYAIVPRQDSARISAEIEWVGNRPAKGCTMRLLATGKSVKWSTDATGVTRVKLPASVLDEDGVALSFEVQNVPLYRDAAMPVEARVQDLISRMTLPEKVGQLLCPLGWPMYTKSAKGELNISTLYKNRMREMPLGNLWAVQRADPWTQKTIETGLSLEESAEVMNMLQRYAVEETRLGIPLLFAEEAPHGHMAVGSTVFPTGLAQASTFDAPLLQQMGEAIAEEVRLRGSHVAFGPVVDLARDARWSRVEETMGEDGFLTGELASSVVRGLQGENPSDGRHVYSVLKHFAAYGVPLGGLNGESVDLGPNALRQDYLVPFEKAVDAGVAGVMTSYNAIDGVPCTANAELLRNVLRGEWGFRGMVFSDLHSIEGVATTQGVARDKAAAAAMALEAGVDIDLEGNAYGPNIERLVKEGRLEERYVDEAVADVLRKKFEMGLFEHPYVEVKAAKSASRSEAHRRLARQIATEGIVLLKNDTIEGPAMGQRRAILPLSKSLRRIAVIGPNADNIYNQLGDYTAPQAEADVVTVLEGIRRAVPDAEVTYVKGCAIRDTTQTDLEAAAKAVCGAEVAVLVLGGSSARDFRTSYLDTGAARVGGEETSANESKSLIPDMESGEGYDRASLDLMGDQEQLLETVLSQGVPVVVVYIEGRPLDMNVASQRAQALLTAWYPGEQGGAAIADVLFGEVSPSGRLPISVPRGVGQLPVRYGYRPAHDYIDLPASPLYAFGYGLTYSHFNYSGLSDNSVEESGNQGKANPRQVSFLLTNEGDCEAVEVAQLYVHRADARVQQPTLQLCAFQRVALKPGESRRVSLSLPKTGHGTFYVGSSSNHLPLMGQY